MSKTKNKIKPMDRKKYKALAVFYMTALLIFILITPTMEYLAYSLTESSMALRTGIMAVIAAMAVIAGILEFLLYKRINTGSKKEEE